MIEARNFTASDLRTAVAVGVRRDRDRIAAILALPEAKGREGLAANLATTTDLSSDRVRVVLTSAPAGSE